VHLFLLAYFYYYQLGVILTFSMLLFLFLIGSIFVSFSTKDPGQKPFTFKIGQGSVIKGSCLIIFMFYYVEINVHIFLK
jgi:hypothetical protein